MRRRRWAAPPARSGAISKCSSGQAFPSTATRTPTVAGPSGSSRKPSSSGYPVKLSLAEVAALVMSRDLLRPAWAGALGAAVTSAFDKIGRVLSRDALQLLDQMRESIGVRAAGAKLQAPAAEHVSLIQHALLHRR